jgi:hypothetical protein
MLDFSSHNPKWLNSPVFPLSQFYKDTDKTPAFHGKVVVALLFLSTGADRECEEFLALVDACKSPLTYRRIGIGGIGHFSRRKRTNRGPSFFNDVEVKRLALV